MTQASTSASFNTFKIAKMFLVLSFLWFAVSYGDVYLNTKEIRYQVDTALRTAALDDDAEIINNLLSRFNRKNIPVTDEDVKIERSVDGNDVRIVVRYRDTVTYFGIGFYKYSTIVDMRR
jgi:hypothetical protein